MHGKYKMGTSMLINSDGSHEKVAPSLDVDVPGPGTYSATHKQIYSSLSAKFGTEIRQGLNSKESAKVPAPNAYHKDAKTAVLRRQPAYGFGTS
jgi:hypothetical protein